MNSSGWVAFGTHVGAPEGVLLEMSSETDEDGHPRWERVVNSDLDRWRLDCLHGCWIRRDIMLRELNPHLVRLRNGNVRCPNEGCGRVFDVRPAQEN